MERSGTHEGGTVAGNLQTNGSGSNGQTEQNENESPPLPGATKGKDGSWYIPHQGGYARVEANA